jgi:hypothetical protein
MLEQKRLGKEGTATARSEQTSQAGDEMDQKDDQIAHHRIVAGQKIPTNYGRNNNSPGTGSKTSGICWTSCGYGSMRACDPGYSSRF